MNMGGKQTGIKWFGLDFARMIKIRIDSNWKVT